MCRIVLAAMMVLSLSVVALAADDKDVKRYEGNGVAFNYPKDLKVQEKAEKGSTVLTIEGAKGAAVNITIIDAPLDPKMLLAETVKIYRGIFKDVVKDSDKAVKRKLFGTESEGQQMEVMILKELIMHNEFFVVSSPSKKTVSISITYPTSEAAVGKKLTAIVESLEASKK